MTSMTNKELISAILGTEGNTYTKTALGKKNKDELEQIYLLLQDKLETASLKQAEAPVDEPTAVEKVEVKEEVKEPAKPAHTAVKADEKVFKTEQPKSASDVFMKDKKRAVEVVIDLDIHKKHFYFAKNTEGKVRVENVGFGDVYFGEGDVVFGNKEQRLLKGQAVELGAKVPIGLLSSSSPRVKITEI